ncbi:MAG: hypothetical protein F6K18_01480 [Okeania sp. SIO2C2]|uniref:hypothetical protein n=1 Tax=Okeania sp. SIO2C2 TaxID=2607787 RepID=UPI0013B7EBCF|nr:hypothetical protein [Okeania sp. SIO2C2]NEP85601.1 hypothetical protein [Okeania sp. SIO2C2]
MSDIAIDMSKKDFRIVVDDEVRDRFKAACKSLETPPSMSSEIEKFMTWFADCVEKKGTKPKLSDISQGYPLDSHELSAGGEDLFDEKILSVLEAVEGVKNKVEGMDNRLSYLEKCPDFYKMSTPSGEKPLEKNNNIGNTECQGDNVIPNSITEDDIIIIGSDYTTKEQVRNIKITPKHRLQQDQMGLRLNLESRKNVPTKEKNGILANPSLNNDPEGLGWVRIPKQQGKPILYKPILELDEPISEE